MRPQEQTRIYNIIGVISKYTYNLKILTFLKYIVKLAIRVPSARGIINVCDQYIVLFYLDRELCQPTLYSGATKCIHPKIFLTLFGDNWTFSMFASMFLLKINPKLVISCYLTPLIKDKFEFK